MRNVLIVILMLIIVTGASYGVWYQIDNHNKENKRTEIEEKKEENIAEKVKFDYNKTTDEWLQSFPEISVQYNALNITNKALGIGQDSYNILYKNQITKDSDLSVELKTYLAFQSLNQINTDERYNYFSKANIPSYELCSNKSMLSESDVAVDNHTEENYKINNCGMPPVGVTLYDSNKILDRQKDLFGANETLANLVNKSVTSCPINYIKNDDINKKLKVYYSFGCGGTIGSHYENRIVAIEKEEKRIYVFEKVYYTTETGIYSEPNGELVASREDETTLGESFYNTYKDKLNTYKYTFKYDKENNNYFFYSIELVK